MSWIAYRGAGASQHHAQVLRRLQQQQRQQHQLLRRRRRRRARRPVGRHERLRRSLRRSPQVNPLRCKQSLCILVPIYLILLSLFYEIPNFYFYRPSLSACFFLFSGLVD